MNEEELWVEVGEMGMRGLVRAFYEGVKADALIGPMYPDDDWEGAEERLWKFLCFRFGNDPRYTQERGHPRLRGRHLPFKIGVRERDRWLELMEGALASQEISTEATATLLAFFTQVADFMRNQNEADDTVPGVGKGGVNFKIR